MGEPALAAPPAVAVLPTEPAPTVGRVVLYRPTDDQRTLGGDGEYWPAVVTRVWSAECVNLHVLTDAAAAFPVTSVMREREDGQARVWRWPARG